MYNKDISEKMLEDAIDMYENISKIKKVCGEIVGRNVVAMIDNDEESMELLAKYRYISKTEREVEKMKEDMIDINGGINGYDTDVWLNYIGLYEGVVRSNKECNTKCNEIREKYM